MKTNRFYLIFLLLFGVVLSSNAQTNCGSAKYSDKNGVVMMESENTTSSFGKWKKKTDNKGYSGSGHLEFTGNGINGGNATSPLKYKFKINEGGYYYLYIRARKRSAGAERDKCNDGYVRVEGDYNAGSNVGNSQGKDAPKSMLSKDTKLYGGPASGWGWTEMLDAGGHHNKRVAVYKFKPGKVYTLVISGRSIRWNMDRIVFVKKSVPESTWKNLTKETKCGSNRDGGNNSGLPDGYKFASNEGGIVKISGKRHVAYGANGKYEYKYNQTKNLKCNNATFGDPIKSSKKKCYTKKISAKSATQLNEQEIGAANLDKVVGVYPNPTSDMFTISINGLENATISIFNFNGSLVYRTKTEEHSINLEKGNVFKSGIYMIKVVDENKNVYNQKLVIQ